MASSYHVCQKGVALFVGYHGMQPNLACCRKCESMIVRKSDWYVFWALRVQVGVQLTWTNSSSGCLCSRVHGSVRKHPLLLSCPFRPEASDWGVGMAARSAHLKDGRQEKARKYLGRSLVEWGALKTASQCGVAKYDWCPASRFGGKVFRHFIAGAVVVQVFKDSK